MHRYYLSVKGLRPRRICTIMIDDPCDFYRLKLTNPLITVSFDQPLVKMILLAIASGIDCSLAVECHIDDICTGWLIHRYVI